MSAGIISFYGEGAVSRERGRADETEVKDKTGNFLNVFCRE